MPNIWKEMYGTRNQAFIDGVVAGITMYAYWSDGVQRCGSIGKSLGKAIEEAKEGLEENKP